MFVVACSYAAINGIPGDEYVVKKMVDLEKFIQ
jgi:hypothetical protein